MVVSEKKIVKLEKEVILEWLKEVKDPEIPTISLVDLGVITDLVIEKDNGVTVNMTPTFAGCPAMDYMKKEVEELLQKKGITTFKIILSFDKPWSSNSITEQGLKAIKKHGLAPPPKHKLIVDIDILNNVACPFCSSKDTTLKSPFGPTLCRSLHYCNNCAQAFEQFKPV